MPTGKLLTESVCVRLDSSVVCDKAIGHNANDFGKVLTTISKVFNLRSRKNIVSNKLMKQILQLLLTFVMNIQT